MRIEELPLGACGTMVGLSEEGVGRMLRRMGFSVGAEVRTVLRRGGLGEYQIGDSLIAIGAAGESGVEIVPKKPKTPTTGN